MITTPGRYEITSEEYHADKMCPQPCLSTHVIKNLVFESPAKARWNHPALNPDFKPDYGNGKFDVGSAAHTLLLESEEKITIVDADDWRKKEAKEAREIAWKSGKVPLLKEQYLRAKDIALAAERQILLCSELGIVNLRQDGDSEVTYIWEEDGTWFKIRPDWISHDRTLILDLKTTDRTANPMDVGRTIVNLHYELQACLYQRGVKKIEGTNPRFVFMFIETEEPYFCSFVELPEMVTVMGEQELENGIFLWKECMSNGKWFGYPNKVVTIESPGWAVTSVEHRLSKIGTEE